MRRVFVGQQQGTAPLSADAQALDQAQHDQQDGRPDANLVIARQQADEHRGTPHQRQGDHQGLLAPDAITDVREDKAAQRTDEEGQRKRQVRQHQPDDRVTGGEKHLAEHQCSRGGVQEVIEPLDGTAHEAGHQYALVRGRARCGHGWGWAHEKRGDEVVENSQSRPRNTLEGACTGREDVRKSRNDGGRYLRQLP
ncbi:hypothetical protein D3C71_1564930 [compost metagenome]